MTEPKKRKHVYRLGDRVTVINPIRVLRVGYPLCYSSMRDKVEDNKDIQQNITDFYNAVGLSITNCKDDYRRKRLTSLLAYTMMGETGFGGGTRRLYTEPFRANEGAVFRVTDKKIVKTGEYYSAMGGYDSYSGDDYYEPGGLDDIKTHQLIRISACEAYQSDIQLITEHDKSELRGLWVEACNLQFLQRGLNDY